MRVTLKGQGQSDPWLTIEGASDETFRLRLLEFLEIDPLTPEADMSTAEMIARSAAVYVKALNSQSGISQQRDNKTAQPAAAAPAASAPRVAPGSVRPGLSSSLSVEDDGNYWIALPYQRNSALGAKQRDLAKELGARYKADEAPASVPRKNGKPERPWCVHQRFVSEENVQELLRLHETGFAEVK